MEPRHAAAEPVQLTPRMTRILESASHISQRKTGERVVGTEHVLRALLDDPDAIATQVLAELGVVDRARTRLDAILRSVGYRTPSAQRIPPRE